MNNNNEDLYVALGWPEYQELMEHPRWSECKYCADENIYFIPKDIYDEYVADVRSYSSI